jgi:hypothetical protein
MFAMTFVGVISRTKKSAGNSVIARNEAIQSYAKSNLKLYVIFTRLRLLHYVRNDVCWCNFIVTRTKKVREHSSLRGTKQSKVMQKAISSYV